MTNPVSTVQDIGDLGLEVLTAGNADVGDYRTQTGAMLSQLPTAVTQDYAQRYGGASNIAEGLYEDPLSYLLDALMVGGAAAKGAELGAKGAIKGSELASGAAAMATERLGPSAGLRVGLEALETEGALGPGLRAAKAILPGERPFYTGPTFEMVSDFRNPVTRALAAPVRRLTSEPLEGARLPEQTLAAAAELGLSRIPSAPLRGLQARRLSARILGESWTRFLHRREGALKAINDTITPYLERNADLAATGHGVLQRLDVDVEGLDSVLAGVGAPRRVTQGAVALHPIDLDPEIRTAAQKADPALLARTDQAATVSREYLDGLHARLGEPGADAGALGRRIEFTNRYLRSLYDPIRRRTLAAGEGVADDAEMMLDDVRLMAHEVLTEPEIRAGFLTPDDAFERAYLPMRMKYGAEWDAKRGTWEGGPDALELDDAVTAAGLGAPVYFPHLDASKLKFRDFLLGRQRVGALAQTKADWRRQNRGILLKNERYLTDPVEAFQRRASQAIRHEETIRLFDELLNRMGRPVSAVDDIGPGEELVAPEGLWRMYRYRVAFDDAFDKLTDTVGDVDEAGAQVMGRLGAEILGEFPEVADRVVLSGLGITKKGVKLYAVPKAAARQMDDMVKAWGGEGTRLFWDAPMNVWRSLVLTFSPRWIFNNFLGNVLFSKMQGARIRDALKILEERTAKAINDRFGTSIKTPTLEALNALPLREQIGSGFSSLESQYISKLGKAADSTTGKIYRSARASKLGKPATRWSDFIRRVNSEIESSFREASFLRALEREQSAGRIRSAAQVFWGTKRRLENLADNGVTEGAAKRAIQEVDRFFGNYTAMTPLERNVIRRFVFPFWGFYRHQAKLLATFPFAMPHRAVVLNQIAGMTGEFFDEYGPVPEWLEGALPIDQYGPGDVSFLSTRGADPFQASFQDPLLAMTPIAKVALEQLTGRNLLTEEEFTDEGVVPGAFGGDQRFQIVRDDQGNIVDVTPAGDVTPGLLEHLLRQVPQYGAAERLLAGGKTYDTTNLIDILQGEGALIDPATGEPRYPASLSRELAKLSGINVTPYDLQEYQRKLAEEAMTALSNAYRSDALAG